MTNQLLKSLIDLRKAINRQSNLVGRLWAITEHRCPVCNKAVTDPLEYEFMEANGECGTCDHVREEANDVLSGMAETNGMSVEDYLEEMGL